MQKIRALLFISLITGTISAQPFEQIHHSYNVLNYELHIDLSDVFSPPYPSLFYASATISFQVDSTLNSIVLDAKKAKLIIDSVGYPAIAFTQDAASTTITLDATYAPGALINLPVYYHHKNVVDESFYAYNGYMYTDSEPDGAHSWFPCWDKPTDKATVELFITSPADVKIGSNGSLMDSTIIGDLIIYHWKSEDPMCTYLVAMVGKKDFIKSVDYWHPLAAPADSIPLYYYYASGENIGDTKIQLPQMLDYFSSLYGDYPFEKYAMGSSIEFYSEGMENQGMTIICKNCWEDWLTAHELAHHWFGDLISPKSWADIFMNEGFAQYNEILWETHDADHAVLEDTIKEYADYYLEFNPGFPISMDYWSTYTPSFDTLFNGVITYTKAPCVMHMLRNVLGDELFFNTLRAYTSDTTDFRFKNVSIQDFNTFVNDYTGMDLDYFFDEWIFQPNHPVYSNAYAVMPDAGTWKVDYTILQTQSDPPFFKMPVELLIHFEDATDSLISIMNDVNDQLFSFNFSKHPVSVDFDPSNKIVLKEASVISGLTEINNVNQFKVFPNPANNFVRLEFNLPKETTANFILKDLTDSVMISLPQTKYPAGMNEIHMDLDNMPPGIYFLLMQTKESVSTVKMVITDL